MLASRRPRRVADRAAAVETGPAGRDRRAEAPPPVPLPADPTPFEKGRGRRARCATICPRIMASEVRGDAAGPKHRGPTDRRRSSGPGSADPGRSRLAAGRAPHAAAEPRPVRVAATSGRRSPPGRLARERPDLPSAASSSLDPAAIGAALGLRRSRRSRWSRSARPTPFPEPATPCRGRPTTTPYAVTWFGLAACLVVVFVVYARRTLRP